MKLSWATEKEPWKSQKKGWEKAQQVKVLAAKSDALSSISRTRGVEGERANFRKLSNLCMNTHMLKTHKQKPKPLYTGKTGPGPESNYDKIHCVIKKKTC